MILTAPTLAKITNENLSKQKEKWFKRYSRQIFKELKFLAKVGCYRKMLSIKEGDELLYDIEKREYFIAKLESLGYKVLYSPEITDGDLYNNAYVEITW